MRILFAADVPPDPNAGASGTELQTIRAMLRMGHDVDAIWAEELGRRIQHGNLHYLLELPRTYRRAIGERCEKREYDVIHANQGHSYLAAIEHRRRRRRGIFVCRSHGLEDRADPLLADWRRRLGMPQPASWRRAAGGVLEEMLHANNRRAYRHCDGVLVSSRLDADFLAHKLHVPEAKIGCVPQAPAPEFVDSPAMPMDAQRLRRLLHVGGLSVWKGTHALAASAGRLLVEDGDASLTWVCRATDHEAVRAMVPASAHGRLFLRDWMSQQELREVYDQHGIFLYPSLFDGFGKVFLEAMARGLCVVVTREGGMPDVIREGREGRFVPPNDPAAIEQAVRALWADPETALHMSSAAAERAREYSWERVGRETLEFYGRLGAHG